MSFSRQISASEPFASYTLSPFMTFPFLQRIVIDKSDRAVIQTRVVSQLTQDHLAAVARTVDQHSPAISLTRRAAEIRGST